LINILNLMWTFFKIGLFTFGGGYAMIPLIMSELTSQGLLSQSEVVDIIAVSQVTPGTFAINAATFSGVKTLGVLGGIFATFGVMLPSIILALLLARFYIKFKDNHVLKNTMYVMRPVVLGLIASAVIVLIPTALFKPLSIIKLNLIDRIDIKAVFVAIASAFAVINYKISPIIVVLLSGVLGILFYQII